MFNGNGGCSRTPSAETQGHRATEIQPKPKDSNLLAQGRGFVIGASSGTQHFGRVLRISKVLTVSWDASRIDPFSNSHTLSG